MGLPRIHPGFLQGNFYFYPVETEEDDLAHVETEEDSITHETEEENIIDPDHGKSLSCSACTLPIFSTPFVDSGKDEYLHDQCVDLPRELRSSVLHPRKSLSLRERESNSPAIDCINCQKPISGSLYYCCPDCKCKLDVLCALPTSTRILHRSHKHRLMAIPHSVGISTSLRCSVCGTKHQKQPGMSYLCSLCGFWIHQQCASLPNIIRLAHLHHHALLLNYGKWPAMCAICHELNHAMGSYSCIRCLEFSVHIMCAVSDRRRFTQLSIRDAKLPGLVSFPIPDEHTDVMRYIIHNATNPTTTAGTSTSSSDDLHKHPLRFHDDSNDNQRGVCNGCLRSISPPFYSCSECLDFFLHDCCVNVPRVLPRQQTRHPHQLLLVQNDPRDPTLDMNCCRHFTP